MTDVTNDVLLEYLNTTRAECIEKFIEHVSVLKKDDVNDGHDILVGSAGKAVDHAIGTVLNLMHDNPVLFVKGQQLVRGDNEDSLIETEFKPGLAQQYWDQVSS